MITRDESKFLIIAVGTLALFVATIVLVIQSVINPTSPTDAFALYFWLSLAWALASGTALFIRTRREKLWMRYIDAEIKLRLRRGLRIEGTRRIATARWFPIFTAVIFGMFSLVAVLSAVAFLYFASR